jgi:vancomycin resistance protein YoaR
MKRPQIMLVGLLVAGAIFLGGWLAALPGPEEAIAGFASSLEGRTPSQVHNVRLALAALEGRVIAPGEVFSFNRAVGPWTVDRGYRKAPVMYDGVALPAWGGGVCQAASTLYNAALLSGLEIVERHRHFWAPKYVALGRDAAVAFPEIDLRFRNPYPAPVRLRARLEGDRIKCRILSRHRPARSITLDREVSGVSQPVELLQPDPGLPPGCWRTRTRGHPGYSVALYRISADRGGTRRELISEDHYPTLNSVLRFGDKGS